MSRLACITCGADLGDAEDPYRDPDCIECLKRSIREEAEAEELPGATEEGGDQ